MKLALNSRILTVQILTNDVQVLILCLSYFITTVQMFLQGGCISFSDPSPFWDPPFLEKFIVLTNKSCHWWILHDNSRVREPENPGLNSFSNQNGRKCPTFSNPSEWKYLLKHLLKWGVCSTSVKGISKFWPRINLKPVLWSSAVVEPAF